MKTKKNILFLLFINFVLIKPIFGHPQESIPVIKSHYLPVLRDSSTWYIVYIFEFFDNYVYKTGDSIIVDSMQYWELLGGNITDEFLFCYLREDTAEKKIYMLTDDKNEEYLLYDFSLLENDTVSIYGFESFPNNTDFILFENLIVKKTDSIETLDGIKRKRIELNGLLYKNVWIEGIGSIGNFLSPGGGIDKFESGELTCFFKNDQKIYYSELAQSWGDCVIIDDIGALDGNRINLYPNPFDHEITIYFKFPQKSTISVINQLGQVVYLKAFNNKEKLELDLSFLKDGMYMVLINNGKEVVRRNVIKAGE